MSMNRQNKRTITDLFKKSPDNTIDDYENLVRQPEKYYQNAWPEIQRQHQLYIEALKSQFAQKYSGEPEYLIKSFKEYIKNRKGCLSYDYCTNTTKKHNGDPSDEPKSNLKLRCLNFKTKCKLLLGFLNHPKTITIKHDPKDKKSTYDYYAMCNKSDTNPNYNDEYYAWKAFFHITDFLCNHFSIVIQDNTLTDSLNSLCEDHLAFMLRAVLIVHRIRADEHENVRQSFHYFAYLMKKLFAKYGTEITLNQEKRDYAFTKLSDIHLAVDKFDEKLNKIFDQLDYLEQVVVGFVFFDHLTVEHRKTCCKTISNKTYFNDDFESFCMQYSEFFGYINYERQFDLPTFFYHLAKNNSQFDKIKTEFANTIIAVVKNRGEYGMYGMEDFIATFLYKINFDIDNECHVYYEIVNMIFKLLNELKKTLSNPDHPCNDTKALIKLLSTLYKIQPNKPETLDKKIVSGLKLLTNDTAETHKDYNLAFLCLEERNFKCVFSVEMLNNICGILTSQEEFYGEFEESFLTEGMFWNLLSIISDDQRDELISKMKTIGIDRYNDKIEMVVKQIEAMQFIAANPTIVQTPTSNPATNHAPQPKGNTR